MKLRHRLSLIMCALADHRWSSATIQQWPTRRLVERRCVRPGCTAHMLAVCEVWDEPTRAAYVTRQEAAS